jgi:hypothetical protein
MWINIFYKKTYEWPSVWKMVSITNHHVNANQKPQL